MNHLKNVGLTQKVMLTRGAVMSGPYFASVGKVQGNGSLSLTQAPPKSTTCEVTLRYKDNICPGDVIGYGSRVLNVVSVIGFNHITEETTVLCREDRA